MVILAFISDIDIGANVIVSGFFALMMFIFQIDDFLIAICMSVECSELKKAEIKYDIVKSDQIKPSPWPFHLGSRMLNHKKVVYEYEGKRRTRMLWANVMIKSKDYRLLLLAPEHKPNHIYAFPFVNFKDVVTKQSKRKDGVYAVYKGKEYTSGEVDGRIILRSTDIEDVEKCGFEKHEPFMVRGEEKPIVCVKYVNPQEIEKYYRVYTNAYYRGYCFSVVSEKGQEVLIFVSGGNQRDWEALGMEREDILSYHKWVKKSEVRLETKETPLKLPQADKYLDDVTYIRDIKHIKSGPWHQYDVLLAARGYGWEAMISWADYMAASDLAEVHQVTAGSDEDITESYKRSNGKCIETPELKTERGYLTIAGISKTLKVPVKIVWINQSRVIRLFTTSADYLLVRKYVETVIRRTFGTKDAMKLGKPIPDKQ